MSAFPPVTDLVPHAPPMVMLDEVVEIGAQHMVCSVTIRAGGPFVEGGSIPALATLEHMAQTVAAWAGWCGRQAGEPVRIGYLLGCRELSLHRDTLPVGTRLTIRIERVWGDSALGSFACEVQDAQGPVSSGVLSVAQPRENPVEFP